MSETSLEPDTVKTVDGRMLYDTLSKHYGNMLLIFTICKNRIAPQAAAERGWCSWCSQVAGQDLVKEHMLTRDLLKCENCKHLTGRCPWCIEGFARAYPDGSMDKLCFRCYHVIDSWATPMSKLEQKQKYCSSCFEV